MIILKRFTVFFDVAVQSIHVKMNYQIKKPHLNAVLGVCYSHSIVSNDLQYLLFPLFINITCVSLQIKRSGRISAAGSFGCFALFISLKRTCPDRNQSVRPFSCWRVLLPWSFCSRSGSLPSEFCSEDS